MSNLKYYAYPGAGEWAAEHLGYSQAVRIGDRIELSGQGLSLTPSLGGNSLIHYARRLG